MPRQSRPTPPASKPPRRFYGNLRMPPVDHAPGAIPEACQPPSDPGKTRKVLWFLAGVLVVVAAWRTFPEVYRRIQPAPQGSKVCCGCTQPGHTTPCPSQADCANAQVATPGCHSNPGRQPRT